MRTSLLAFLALASATALKRPSISSSSIPSVPVLPLPGNSANNGFNSLSDLFISSSGKLDARSDDIGTAHGKLTTDTTIDTQASKADLVKAFHGVSTEFWSLAVETEKKVCAIASSISKQNLNNIKADLDASVQAQISSILKVKSAIDDTIDTIESQVVTFSDSEKAVIGAALDAISKSATASLEPIKRLTSGLQAAGISGLTSIASDLEGSVNSLVASANAGAKYNV